MSRSDTRMQTSGDNGHLSNKDEDEVKPRATGCEDAMICERCGKAEMYRMHAVWRCPECGFKTDCCGW